MVELLEGRQLAAAAERAGEEAARGVPLGAVVALVPRQVHRAALGATAQRTRAQEIRTGEHFMIRQFLRHHNLPAAFAGLRPTRTIVALMRFSQCLGHTLATTETARHCALWAGLDQVLLDLVSPEACIATRGTGFEPLAALA